MYNTKVNQLSQSVFGEVVFSSYQPPSQYTGEHFGVQYLYNQTGRSLNTTDGDVLDAEIDEGFGDVDDIDEPAVPPMAVIDQDEHLITVATPVDPDSDEEEEVMYTHFCNFYHKSAYYALHTRIYVHMYHVHVHAFSFLTTHTYTCTCTSG